MDEPLSSLDAPLRRELRAFLRSTLFREGVTTLHVTHDVEEALELGDELFIMNQGRIVARGEPRAIFEGPPDAWCVGFLGLGFLFPVLGVEARGGRRRRGNRIRLVRVPSTRPQSLQGRDRDGEKLSLCPEKGRIDCLRFSGETEAGGAAIGILDAKVESVVFQGTFQKIELMPSPVRTAQDPSSSFGANKPIEVELDPSIPIARGERVLFSVDSAQCSIVPGQDRP